jgi:hypothetical protein
VTRNISLVFLRDGIDSELNSAFLGVLKANKDPEALGRLGKVRLRK